MVGRFVPTLLLTLTCAAVVPGCISDEEHANLDGTLDADGYALFVVENNRQQRNDVTIRVKDVDPNATYVLFYATEAPKSVGWFQFDPNTKSRCGGDLGPHCHVDDFGYLVDFAKPAEGQTEVTLRDDRCGCDANHEDRSWSGYWAVMRVERTNRSSPITVDVWSKRIKDFASEPDITQLQ